MNSSASTNNHYSINKTLRITPIGYKKYLKGLIKNYILYREGKLLESLSVRSWKIAPSYTTIIPKAYFLDGQLQRVTGTAVTGDPNVLMLGGNEKTHAPTHAYALKDVWMLDGSLYKGFNKILFHPRHQISNQKNYFPPVLVDTEINHASIYHTFDGFKAFGIWLSDDCTNYLLSENEGIPVTSNIFASPHMLEYESLLDMKPLRTNAAYLKNVVLFNDDWDNNRSKHERFSINRNKLLSKFPGDAHPGVFIIRGNSGNKRVMLNEIEIAEKLQATYGLRIVDVTKHTVTEILTACVGAKILIGVEGSHLMHGLMVLQPGASVLALQPPNRFCGVLKMTTDMEAIHYGFVVGIDSKEGFHINIDEVERTIDLLPKTF